MSIVEWGSFALYFSQVTIKQASGLPLSLSNFVFCQYSFWNHPDSIAVPPVVNPEYPVTCVSGRDSMTFKFDHSRDFDVPVTEEFLERCSGKFSSSSSSYICLGLCACVCVRVRVPVCVQIMLRIAWLYMIHYVSILHISAMLYQVLHIYIYIYIYVCIYIYIAVLWGVIVLWICIS
jgi:hypothetical protein